jgi:hypothetical protein
MAEFHALPRVKIDDADRAAVRLGECADAYRALGGAAFVNAALGLPIVLDIVRDAGQIIPPRRFTVCRVVPQIIIAFAVFGPGELPRYKGLRRVLVLREGKAPVILENG